VLPPSDCWFGQFSQLGDSACVLIVPCAEPVRAEACTANTQPQLGGPSSLWWLLADRFKTYTSDAFAEKLQALCGLLEQAADAAAAGGGAATGTAPTAGTTGRAPAVVDLHQMMYRFTLDTFSHIGFAQDPGCLSGWEPIPFATSFDRAQTVSTALVCA
jgi:hypothetical protein